MKTRRKMTWRMKQALDRKGYDPKKCRCIGEDERAWLFETTADDGEEESAGSGSYTFWIEKG